MEPNTRFKGRISLFSLATITIAAILFTLFVMNHEHIEAGAQALFLFALIFFGPVSLFFLIVLNSGWPIAIQAVLLLINKHNAPDSSRHLLAIKVLRQFERSLLVFVGAL